MLLGCIGDDFTGSSDLANTLAKQGMRTVQYTGIPKGRASSDVEAGVIALKSRSNQVDDAIEQSLGALEWLKDQGCEQFFFKYCSTFDSTKQGNIGPVADALADALDADRVIFCPAFPGTGRTLYHGHLFVNDRLLNESGMENHPLTPMVDADIRRWLQYQTSSKVGGVNSMDVSNGVASVKKALEREHNSGNRFVVVDAICDDDLFTIGAAAEGLPLITGGSGIALGLPDNFRRNDRISAYTTPWEGESGPCAVLSGSCSLATRGQVDFHRRNQPSLEVSPADVIEGITTPGRVADWLLHESGVPLAYTSTDPESVKQIQEKFGKAVSASAIEGFFAEVARLLVAGGVRRLIVAGGETSGAVVEGVDIGAMEVGPQIDPGVPAMRAQDNLVVTLKSGNFGAEDFFSRAAAVLAGELVATSS